MSATGSKMEISPKHPMEIKPKSLQLGTCIGGGGFAKVFAGTLERGDKVINVAIKRLIRSGPEEPRDVNIKAIEAVKMEADNLRSVIHSNIIQCHGIIVDPLAGDLNGKPVGCCVVLDLCTISLRRALDHLNGLNDGVCDEDVLFVVKKLRLPETHEKV